MRQLQQYFKSYFAHKHLSRDGLVSLQTIIAPINIFFFLFVIENGNLQYVFATFSSTQTHPLFNSKGIEISEDIGFSHLKFENSIHTKLL